MEVPEAGVQPHTSSGLVQSSVAGWITAARQAMQHGTDCLAATPQRSGTSRRVAVVHRSLPDGGFVMSTFSQRSLQQRKHSSPFAALIPGNSVAEQVITTGTSNFLNLYNAALIGRVILTWFPSPPAVIAGPLSTLCDPYLNLFRGLIPPIGGQFDVSPILAFLVLNLFTDTANALPAEMPQHMKQQRRPAKGQHARRSRLQALRLPGTNRQ